MLKPHPISEARRPARGRLVVVLFLALYLAGVFWGIASAAVSCKLTVVFTDSGRTIVTVTPKSGPPVRYVCVVGGAVALDPAHDAQRPRINGPLGELSPEPAPGNRARHAVRTAIVLSKTGFRVLKTTLSSAVAALRQR